MGHIPRTSGLPTSKINSFLLSIYLVLVHHTGHLVTFILINPGGFLNKFLQLENNYEVVCYLQEYQNNFVMVFRFLLLLYES